MTTVGQTAFPSETKKQIKKNADAIALTIVGNPRVSRRRNAWPMSGGAVEKNRMRAVLGPKRWNASASAPMSPGVC